MRILKYIVCLSMLILIGGCSFFKPSENNGNGEPVVSPTNISNQVQGNGDLYLEDTEHWWEGAK